MIVHPTNKMSPEQSRFFDRYFTGAIEIKTFTYLCRKCLKNENKAENNEQSCTKKLNVKNGNIILSSTRKWT